MARFNDVELPGWTPPKYEVSKLGKVSNAQPGKHNNWGRWGEEDQVGTVNLLTPELVKRAAGLIRTGERYSLGLPIGIPKPGGHDSERPGTRRTPGRGNLAHFFGSTAGDAVLGDGFGAVFTSENVGDMKFHVTDDFIMMALQHTTQLDGFGFGINDALYNGYWAGLVTARSGMRRLGMHKRTKGIVGHAILLDVARHMGVDRLEDGYRIGPDLLLEVAQAEGLEIEAGDTLLIRTGWLGWWLQDESSTHGDNPGISAAAIPLMAERDVAMVAHDNLGTEVTSSPEPEYGFLGFHRGALRDLGMGVGEFFDLDELAEASASDGVYEMFFMAAPLPIIGAGGSPLNPIAIR